MELKSGGVDAAAEGAKGVGWIEGEKGSAGVRNSVVAQEAVWRPSVRSRFPVGAQLRFRRSKRCCQAR